MPFDHPEPVKAGDPIIKDAWDRLADMVERALNVGVDPTGGLHAFSGPFGTSISRARPQEFWIKLTSHGSSGQYAWTEQVPAAGGGWTDGARSGTTTVDPAIEANANTGLTADSAAPIVWAWREKATGELRFQGDACG
jgi:hypothetical protein